MRAQAMRLISWNLNGRVSALCNQINSLGELQPDIVALQEVLAATAPRLREGLGQRDLVHSLDSFGLAADPTLLKGRRKYGEILASRWPLSPLPPVAFSVPWNERVLSAVCHSPWGDIEIHTAGIPPGASNGWLKVQMFEGIYRRLACVVEIPRILCGDLNAPQAESFGGQITTWGQDIKPDGSVTTWKTWRDASGYVDTGERWDLAERSVLAGLAKYDLPDVFRSLHGYGVVEYSWYWKGKGRCIGRRFDHVFASRQLHAVRCEYLHALREMGLSDHSAIEVDFARERTERPTAGTERGSGALGPGHTPP
jgi:exodeoxyribonuclease III